MATKTRLAAGDRLILYSNGITNRRTADGTLFGLAGIETAVAPAPPGSAAATIKAIEAAVLNAATGSLEDDATLIVLATDATPLPCPVTQPF